MFGRNAVAEAIKSGRVIDTLVVAKGERGGSIGQIISRCKEKGVVVKENGFENAVITAVDKTVAKDKAMSQNK